MKHSDLLPYAHRALKNTFKCPVILIEPRAHHREIPDAIGFKADCSIVIECKITRADFFADQQKTRTLGNWRFYLTPPDLIQKHELPKGWGLIELNHLTHGGVQGNMWTLNMPFKSSMEAERRLLYSALRRKK